MQNDYRIEERILPYRIGERKVYTAKTKLKCYISQKERLRYIITIDSY